MTTESPGGRTDSPRPQHLKGYKDKGTPFREALRQRCKERLKQSRADVVQRLRFGDANGATSMVDSLVMEEMKSLRAEADDSDYEEEDEASLLATLEDISRELRQEELRILAEHQLTCENEAITAALEDDPDHVVCPICRQNRLLQNKQVIFCPCGVRLDTQLDGVTLANMKAALRNVMDEHKYVECALRFL